MTIEKILIVDDELIVRNFLSETLRRKHFEVTVAEGGLKAIALCKETTFDLVITDMKMPDLTGIEVLKKVKELSPSTVVIIITAFGSIENAVEAMQYGAFNYLLKPFSPDTVEAVIEKAREHLSLVAENTYLRQQLSASRPGLTVIAESPSMQRIINEAKSVAKSNTNVFIHGESGTGKEVVAQIIHNNSLRANRPFIKVNCAAVPETLIESEFFGHEKGAFTGASARRLGRFELAHTGTLLLDEITETPLPLQAKLLRVTQEQEFERVGGSRQIIVDVRLISTSNRDMKEAIAEKRMREDLFYRLNVFPILIPPLRERKEDIIPLAEYFITKSSLENHREKKTLSADAKKKLLAYDWPGNVRELSNIIERAIVLDNGKQIGATHLFIESQESPKDEPPAKSKDRSRQKIPIGLTLQEVEKRLILATLLAHQNNTTKAAEMLGISQKVLKNKILEYKIAE